MDRVVPVRLAAALRWQLAQQVQDWLRAEQKAPEGEAVTVAVTVAVAMAEMKR